jgi:L-alanine-DL-glutamate epimerase-like enolase superfamily enzyme
MYAVTEYAIQKSTDTTFKTPPELLERLLPDVHEYAVAVTRHPELRLTFTLNALVPVDNAAWTLYAKEHGIRDFMAMIPETHRPPLTHPGDRVASVPALSYNTTPADVRRLADSGYFVMKIKLGNPGDPDKMLELDKAQLEMIHQTLKDYRTKHTPDGRIPYYLDMNMRYQNKEDLRRLLDHAAKIGAFDRILVLEDPFPEELKVHVNDLGVPIAADEPAHTPEGVRERRDLGYTAIALKPAAKTLTMTLSILDVAYQHGMPAFCADLSVSPALREWNKMVAARVKPFPRLGMGMLETNGHQFYADWDRLMSYHPHKDAPWADARDGAFHLDADYYEKSGGLFDISPHYLNLVQNP